MDSRVSFEPRILAASLVVAVAAPALKFAAPVDLEHLNWALAAVVAAVSLAGAARPDGAMVRRARWFLVLLGVGAAGLLAGSVFSPHSPLSGDEPAYLVMASSLAHDRDLEVGNNYRQKDYQAFGVPAYPTFADRGRDGRLYPHHGAGLGLALAPLVRLSDGLRGPLGPGGVVLLLRVGMGAVLGVYLGLAWRLAVELGARPVHALAAAAAAGLSCPLVFYSTQIYPDVPAGACLTLLALARPSVLGSLAALVLLPLLGIKFLPPAAVLAAALCVRRWRDGRRRVCALTVAALAAGALAMGMTRPPPDLAAHLTAEGTARLELLPWWLFGYLMDQRAGLLALSPFFVVGAAGLGALSVRRHGPLLLAVGVYLGVYAYHLDWGGLCPPGRPLVAVLWLPIGLAALGLGRVRAGLARILAIGSGLITVAYALDHHALFLHLHPNANEQPSTLLRAWSLPGLDSDPAGAVGVGRCHEDSSQSGLARTSRHRRAAARPTRRRVPTPDARDRRRDESFIRSGIEPAWTLRAEDPGVAGSGSHPAAGGGRCALASAPVCVGAGSRPCVARIPADRKARPRTRGARRGEADVRLAAEVRDRRPCGLWCRGRVGAHAVGLAD